jgi:hypothetical protein
LGIRCKLLVPYHVETIGLLGRVRGRGGGGVGEVGVDVGFSTNTSNSIQRRGNRSLSTWEKGSESWALATYLASQTFNSPEALDVSMCEVIV